MTPRELLLEELERERFAPLLSPSQRRQPRARQVAEPESPGARPTGTGWPA